MSIGSSSTTACHLCGENSRLMHNLPHFRTVKSFCTDCVLHLHARSFCPLCFEVYEDPDTLTSDVVLSCVRCLSSSHITCLGSQPDAPYLCPMCVNPESPLLVLRDMNEGKGIDKEAARALLAACKISAVNMRKAAAAATMDAEVKVLEAINAKKMLAHHLNGLIPKQNQ